ncbi:LytTR family transcriptional regulator [Kordia periserrulae]|uniref:LytTR family transcriptional regulator n=1 Tax=Kordia periserrulae TaxID=701523 RepID=A0A2T6BWE8_9FLAO|nr:LytTR family DNA-binding domain-containing protein [Kordia periserrulae]PTX60402.1 LytTR family transcriptional regulator [Kordia periserrulae]
MLNFLKKPHPFIFNAYSVAIPGVASFLIILLLAPLDFKGMEITQRSIYALCIGGFVSIIIFSTVKLLQKLFPTVTQEDRWTIGKEISLFLLVVLLITLGIFLGIFILYGTHESAWQLFVKTAFISICISFFPIVILVLFEQYLQQKKQFKYAQQLTQSLKAENQKLQTEKQHETTSDQQLQLKAENGKVELQLFASELICLQSDGNYVEVFYEIDKTVHKKLLRNRLKSLEEFLPKTTFFRCHNRFIINGNYIVHVTGNARNLELTLRGMDATIPVSRSKATQISEFIQTL